MTEEVMAVRMPHETLAGTVHRLLPHIDTTGKGRIVVDELEKALARERTFAPEYARKAEEIRLLTPDTGAHANALDGIARSWELTDPACQALALADAQVWATLHLAEITQRIANQLDTLDRIANNIEGR